MPSFGETERKKKMRHDLYFFIYLQKPNLTYLYLSKVKYFFL